MKRILIALLSAMAFTPGVFYNHALADESYAEISMNEVRAGSLLLRGEQAGQFLQQPAMDTSVNVDVIGMLATHEVSQTFVNATDATIDAIYVFPLPDDAAVDTLFMTIGNREVEGEIQTKDEARRIYQEARQAGQRASLVERHRPNLFSTQLTNIGPGESIEITIGFQSSVRYDDGIFHLNLPTTVTERYVPGSQFQTESVNDNWQKEPVVQHQWGGAPHSSLPNSSAVPDSGVEPADAEIRVVLHSGFPLSQVRSDSHSLNIQRDGLKWTVLPAAGGIAMDRDFNLSWQPVPGNSPLAAVFTQQGKVLRNGQMESNAEIDSAAESFASLMLIPPQQLFDDNAPPREVIFVLDKSGSMGGTSMPAAKKALKQGIERLSEQDAFNVVTFDNDTNLMFSRAIPASSINKKKANAKISFIKAGGGTEIMGAFKAAFDSEMKFQSAENARLRQIVFITDGSVGNEAEVYAYLKRNLGSNRIFTVGIGAAPNRWFMRKAAEFGRGSYTHIATTAEVKDKMHGLFHKIERPVLSNIQLTFKGIDSPEFYPEVVPDLYAGEPIVVNARVDGGLSGGELVISGNHDGLAWNQHLSLAPSPKPGVQFQQTGLDKLWAYNKISALEDQLLFSANQSEIKANAITTALNYSIVSDYTSLVAVDKTDLKPDNTDIFAQADNQVKKGTRLVAANNTAAAPLIDTSASAVVAAPTGSPMAVPEGNLGIVARLLLSLMLTCGVGVFAKLTGKKNETTE